jgi:hypothetical protein
VRTQDLREKIAKVKAGGGHKQMELHRSRNKLPVSSERARQQRRARARAPP